MSIPSKVLWGEGLFLRPQHFQQQDRYHEARLNQTACALHPYAWGVRRLAIDHDALRNDLLRVEELSLLFADGEVYRAPDGDVLPPQVRLGDLPLEVQSVTYHAALPALKAHGDNCAPDEQADELRRLARFARHERETHDLYTQAAEAPVSYLRKSLRLVAEGEALEAYESFPLLRLRRVATGGFEVDPGFMPPSLAIDAAPGLHGALARLMEKMLAKVNALYGHLREPSRNVVEIRGGDMSSFWLLHTASSAYAALAHHYQHPALHPERLFAQLLDVAGGLMTFSKSWTLADLPVYQHADPGPGFAKLHNIIRELLDTVISSKYFAIALSETRPCYHLGALDSGKIDEDTTFYIAVSADIPALELVDMVPVRFKVGAPDDVEKFVLSALPGVRLQYAPQVPAAVPVRPDTCYFLLEAKGPMYERMLKAQSISIYVPAGMKELKLELLAVVA